MFDQPLAGFTNTSTVPNCSMLASKSPTTTVLPLMAMEMPNQSFFARLVGVSSASCCQLAGTARAASDRVNAAHKIRIEVTKGLRIGNPLQIEDRRLVWSRSLGGDRNRGPIVLLPDES